MAPPNAFRYINKFFFKFVVMLFRKPKILCQAPVYRSIAELVQIATNHPELVRNANYSDDEYYPEDKLDAIDHIASVMGQTPAETQKSPASEVKTSVEVENPSEPE